jgi:hypothetical protein
MTQGCAVLEQQLRSCMDARVSLSDGTKITSMFADQIILSSETESVYEELYQSPPFEIPQPNFWTSEKEIRIRIL